MNEITSDDSDRSRRTVNIKGRRSPASGWLPILLTFILAFPDAPRAQSGSDVQARPEPELAVGFDAEAPGDPDRSYDYFPPLEAGGATLVFISSRFWKERPPVELVLRGLVKGLIQAGHGVVILRHRSGELAVHPGPIRDVARGFAASRERLAAAGADLDRIFLAGHASGAQLALQLALDPQWLALEGLSPSEIAGVISLSGTLDLEPSTIRTPEEERFVASAFPEPATRRASSPMALLDGDRPPILVLTASRDIPGYPEDAERFVQQARKAGRGAIERFVAVGRDHFTILDQLSQGGPPHLRLFLESRPRQGELPEMWQIAQTWREPPFSTEAFHTRFAPLVREHEADESFIEAMNRPFQTRPGAPIRLRARRYAAIDLVDLLAALEREGTATFDDDGFLAVTNVRGEQFVLSMERLRALAPRVVIGLDDERNLFRATDLYHTNRRYSWTEAEAVRVDMARPLGAFLYFPGEEPNPREAGSLFGRYGLTVASFEGLDQDPNAIYADLPELGRLALTERHHCTACHRFREVGGRAFHLRARDAVGMGGHALPLERYPEVVWKRFIFEQRAVAEEVGADVVVFEPTEADALYRMVSEERVRRGVDPWLQPERDRLEYHD